MADDLPNNEELRIYILEYYQALREHFVSHGDRLWNRFNYFLTVESALCGALLITKPQDGGAARSYLVPALGVGLSLVWWAIAAHDVWFYYDARTRRDQFRDKMVLPKLPGWTDRANGLGDSKWRNVFAFRCSAKYGTAWFSPACAFLFCLVWIVLAGLQWCGVQI